MGFDGLFPVSTSTPITYDLFEKLWIGWFYRKIAMGVLIWPPPDNAFPGGTDSGTVAAAYMSGDNLTVTCNIGGSWGTSINGGCGPKRWVNYTCTECFASNIPASYDVVIVVDLFSPRTHVRAKIMDQVDPPDDESTGDLIVDPLDIQNAITAGYINGISDLQGKEYYIIKRGGAWMSDRWPERPDDQQQWRGNGSGGTGHFGDDLVTVYRTLLDSDPKTSWGLNAWAGKQVMVYGNGGKLKRLTILQNDKNTLYVANDDNSAGIGGVYSIVDIGAKCKPDSRLWHYGQWYSGMGNVEAGHLWDDSLGTCNVVKTDKFKYVSGDKCTPRGCDPDHPLYVDVFDEDYQVDPLDSCAGSMAGNFINRHVWKCFRMLMLDMERNCSAFIPIKSDNYEGATVINPYTPATWFRDMGCSSSTSETQFYVTNIETAPANDGTGNTIAYEYGYYYFNVDGEFIGKPIRWTVLDKDGKTYATGTATPGVDGKVTAFSLPYNGKDVKLIGVQVIYSVPWTRIRPRLVKYLYPITFFVPEVGSLTIGGDPQIIDPPQAVRNDNGTYDCSLVGLWIHRPASTAGVNVLQGEPKEGEALIVGELYRYIGDNYRDPFPGGPVTGNGALTNPYYNRAYRGHLSPINQSARDASRKFKISAGNSFSLTQDDWNWHSDWASGGVLRIESFKASSGSATTFVDNTKRVNNPNFEDGCWLTNASSRYAASVYGGFIFRVDKMRTLPDPDPATIALNPQATIQQVVTFKVPIKSLTSTATQVTITFDAFDIPKYNAANQTWTTEQFVVHHNDDGRIIEPRYELNKWQDRTVKITKPDGTVMEDLKIKYSDENTLYFDPQSQPFEAGSTVQIIEMGMGVYRYMGNGVFEPAEGADSARVSVGSPNDFLADINFNNEGWVKDYGVPEYHDMMHPVWVNEIYRGQDLLRWTLGPLGWTNKSGEDAEPEKNARDARAQLPYWTESPQFYAYFVQSVADYNANNDPDISIDNVAYNNHDDAWKRCWKAIFDYNDPYHGISEAEYTDHLNGGDGTVALDNTPPQQCGQFEDCYAYLSKYDGFYLYCGGEPNCAFANYWDESVLNAYISMRAVESYGYVSPQQGFKRLSATVVGVVHAVIGPGDPEEGYFFPYGDHTGTDFCTQGSRIGSTKNKFEEAGSGAIWRKYHNYSSWSVEKGTNTKVYGPKYGSKNFIGDPSPSKLPCLNLTCTYDYNDGNGPQSYKPCQGHDDYGQMGWYIDQQFSIIQWKFEGY